MVAPVKEKPEKTSGISHVRLNVMLPPFEKPAAKMRLVSMHSCSSDQSVTARIKSTSLTAPRVLHWLKPAFQPRRGLLPPRRVRAFRVDVVVARRLGARVHLALHFEFLWA